MISFMSEINYNIGPATFSFERTFNYVIRTCKEVDSLLTSHTFPAQSSKISKKSNSVLISLIKPVKTNPSRVF